MTGGFMRAGFADRLLDIAFKFAKVISVLLAMLLVLAFLGGIGWSLTQSVGSGGGEDTGEIRFDNEMNQLKASMSGVEAPEAIPSGQGIELSNKMRSKYGDALGKSMTNARCSTQQYEAAMLRVNQIAADEGTEPFLSDVVNGAIKWFNDAAAYQQSVGGADPDWYCGDHYWDEQQGHLEVAAAKQKLRTLEILKGFGFSFMALFAAFGLMVIPAIYRIEESVRNRPLP